MAHGSKKVVIVGAGFGGLETAKALNKRQFGDITIIDKTNHHLFQPLLYQVASAALSPNDIAVPVREIFRDHDNTFVLMGEVVRIDKEGQFVEMRDKSRLAYDYLILSPGARHSYFGHPEWEAIAPGLKTLEDALFIREKILLSFEKAERCACAEDAEAYLNFVVIGGGPTGVELSGAIAEIAFKTMRGFAAATKR